MMALSQIADERQECLTELKEMLTDQKLGFQQVCLSHDRSCRSGVRCSICPTRRGALTACDPRDICRQRRTSVRSGV